jgi:cytochrome c553
LIVSSWRKLLAEEVRMRALDCLVGVLVVVVTLALLPAAVGAGPLDAPGYAKAFSCSACHGFGGNSRSDTVPILAEMLPAYFKKAIEDYASGRRPAAEMEPYAKMVRQLGVDDVATYFAAQKKEPTPGTVARGLVERGRGASATCAGCHGPTGKGDPARVIPDLTGQPAGYLLRQMILFKADQRSPGDPVVREQKAMMRGLSDETLTDLAAYYSSVR